MKIITTAQVIIAILLMIAILLQSKGSGLGSAWGGESSFYHTKKGMEKVLFIGTIILSILFFTASILNFIFN